jgi:hypothetical protein
MKPGLLFAMALLAQIGSTPATNDGDRFAALRGADATAMVNYVIFASQQRMLAPCQSRFPDDAAELARVHRLWRTQNGAQLDRGKILWDAALSDPSMAAGREVSPNEAAELLAWLDNSQALYLCRSTLSPPPPT